MAEALHNDSNSDFSDSEQSPLDLMFNKASDHVRKITSNLDNNQLLELYGLFKQSTEGKCETPKPSWFDGKGRRKWEAWRLLDEMPQNEAKQKYVDLVRKYDINFESGNVTKAQRETWVAVSSLRHTSEPDLRQDELSILDAARENLEDRIKELLYRDPQLIQERDEDGLTALHWAADRNSTNALTILITNGCDVNITDNSGQTALHYAVSCGHIQSTRLLLNAGALLIKDENGCTPLDLTTEDEIEAILSASQ